MVSISGHLSTEPQTLNKPKTLEIKNMFDSIRAHVALHPCFWLFMAVFVIQIVIVFVTCGLPLSPSLQQISPAPAAGDCNSGEVYVYDLPAMFNKELTDNCNDSDPYNWRCQAVSNDGFGRRATELAGILPENLAPAWYKTNQFSSEILFHNRMLSHKCRTLDPESATAFYIPFYAGLAVGKYLWIQNHTMRDRDCEMLLRWVQDQPFWKRSNGWDHFITLGRIIWDFRRLNNPELGWGSSFVNMPAMTNVTRFTIERAPSEYLDVGVPYPTGFHPRSDDDVSQWQEFVRNRNRTSLYCFVGMARGDIKNDFRGLLLSECANESDSCRAVGCSETRCSIGYSESLEAFLSSDFCLQPRGDSYTRRSTFDCMVAGSIPVFFWNRTAYNQYEWFLPVEPESYSVYIDHYDVRNGTSIKGVLERYSREEVRRMRERVIEYIPKFVYAKPSEGLESIRDAFDVAIDGVFKRFKGQRQIENMYN
ncbi:xyloglucan galactosyltransferase XLT2-like [Cornus florida]|uniref:xyloglucan galactosyltransferase XLT2-like n=1 Tax=Cornus florida TaxID=4283 RepID=UPI00289DEDC5|nr:xyloglucan galactosyltransferase XLT2-like [Cornus florida]